MITQITNLSHGNKDYNERFWACFFNDSDN